MFKTVFDTIADLWNNSGFMYFFTDDGWKNAVMILISLVFLYLAIAKKYEPLLLLPISFGILLANLPLADLNSHFGPLIVNGKEEANGSLMYYLYQGVHLGIFPPLFFLGVITSYSIHYTKLYELLRLPSILATTSLDVLQ